MPRERVGTLGNRKPYTPQKTAPFVNLELTADANRKEQIFFTTKTNFRTTHYLCLKNTATRRRKEGSCIDKQAPSCTKWTFPSCPAIKKEPRSTASTGTPAFTIFRKMNLSSNYNTIWGLTAEIALTTSTQESHCSPC